MEISWNFEILQNIMEKMRRKPGKNENFQFKLTNVLVIKLRDLPGVVVGMLLYY